MTYSCDQNYRVTERFYCKIEQFSRGLFRGVRVRPERPELRKKLQNFVRSTFHTGVFSCESSISTYPQFSKKRQKSLLFYVCNEAFFWAFLRSLSKAKKASATPKDGSLFTRDISTYSTEKCFITHINEETFLSLLRKLRISRVRTLTRKNSGVKSEPDKIPQLLA